MKKIVVSLIFLSLPWLCSALHFSEQNIKFVIQALENRSNTLSKVNETVIKAYAKMPLKKAFAIPFCTWLLFKNEILHDDPYMPANALILEIDGICYGIWQDEQGIWYARKYIPGTCSKEDCLPKRLMASKNMSLENVEKAIKFLLIIDHNCSLRLCKISNV